MPPNDLRSVDALLAQGQSLVSRGDLKGALEAARKAVAAQPESARVHGFLGYVLGCLDRFDEAIGELCAALEIEPASWETISHLSAILFWVNRSEEMLPWLERAVVANPRLAAAHQLLGSTLIALGRNDDARRSLERALALDPTNGSAHLALSGTKTYTPDDPHLAQMDRMFREGPALPDAARAEFQFALAKAYADTGDNDRAFFRLTDANRTMRQRFNYDEQRTLATFAHTQSVFTPEFLRAREGLGDASGAPVFVVGMPRSGSTLIEQIIAGHPAAHGIGESRAFLKALSPALRQFPDDVAVLDDASLRGIAKRYLAETRARAPDAARVVDKMLSNFVFVGLIHLVFPNARFIHAVRDPVDTCLSCYATHFHESQPFTYDLRELGRYYDACRKLMDHWKAALPEGSILDVHYETLVADLPGEARRMIAHCGLDWDDACLDFANTKRPVWTASAAQVRRPLYQSSVGRWRPASHLLKPLLDGLGASL